MSTSESVPDVPQTGAQASQSSHAAQGSIVQHPSAGAMAGIMPPGRLDTTANIADNWKVWKQMWSNYMVIAKLDSQPPEYKVALFLHCIGVEALKIFNGFQFDSPEDRNDMAKIIEKFDQFTIGELNETFERYTFNSRNQQENESIDVYVTALRTLAKTCNFCDCMHDSIIRDRIVLGIQDKQTRKRLLQERKLTLKSCIDLCKSSEATNAQLKTISGAQNAELHSVKDKHQQSRRRESDRSKKSREREPETKSRKTCKFCGGAHRFEKGKCPAWGAKCTKCGGRNHFETQCMTPPRKLHSLRDESSDDSDVEYITSVVVQPETVHAVTQGNYPKEIYTEMVVNKKTVKFQVDSGASVNVIPVQFVADDKLESTTKTLQMWNDTILKPLGSCRIILQNPKNKKKFSVEFLVVDKQLTPLIGAKAAQQMGLITVNLQNFKFTEPPERLRAEVKSVQTTEEIVANYPEIFQRELGTLPGTVHLEVEQGAIPVVAPPRRVPTSLKAKLKKELDRLQQLEVIAPIDEPTPWVNSLAVVVKKSGALRICIDPRPLNNSLKRERYPLPVLEDILPELSKARVFSTVDLKSGYWHCVLAPESSVLTTFATPYGRYRWRRLPFGLCASSEIFQKHLNQALENLPGVLCIADDILIYGTGEADEEATADHDRNLQSLLQRCLDRGIVLSPEKMKLRRKEVAFMGHILTSTGLKPDPAKVEAITNMPKPKDIEGVQRLNGFINYLAKFLPKLSEVMEPIRRLTRKDTQWQWATEQDKAFQDVQKLVTEAPVLSYYDPSNELTIQCDASQSGLGAALLQNGRPIEYASRALTETETRYAQIEKEMLAIVFSLERFNQYTFGRHVNVESDHKPLETILQKPLVRAPRRLQSMMMRLQKYDFTVHYERGTNMHLADMLSRAYLPFQGKEEDDIESVNMVQYLPISDKRLNEIREETRKDQSLRTLSETILLGWPDDKKDAPALTHPYFSMRDELTVQDGLIFKGNAVVIPRNLRGAMKAKIHSSHLGIEACLRRARECLYWPAMSAEIKEYISACEICRELDTTSQAKETLMSHEVPSRPWEKIGTDIFTLDGKDYLVTIDYFSNFWEVDRLPNTKAITTILKLKSHFARYGIPDQVMSDNGPQFSSKEFADFARSWDFEHLTSSPGHSKSNGKAESGVKTAKRILRKSIKAGTDPNLAILDYRNTPTQGMTSSPAQRLMSRRTKTLLPTTQSLLLPKNIHLENEKRELRQRQQVQAKYYNRTARDLPSLSEGDVVRMKPFKLGDKSCPKAQVTTRLDERSYTVETEDGAVYRRNRQHLRRTSEPPTHPVIPEQSTDASASEEPTVTAPFQSSAIPQQSPVPPVTSTPKQSQRPQRVRMTPAYLKDYVRD